MPIGDTDLAGFRAEPVQGVDPNTLIACPERLSHQQSQCGLGSRMGSHLTIITQVPKHHIQVAGHHICKNPRRHITSKYQDITSVGDASRRDELELLLDVMSQNLIYFRCDVSQLEYFRM